MYVAKSMRIDFDDSLIKITQFYFNNFLMNNEQRLKFLIVVQGYDLDNKVKLIGEVFVIINNYHLRTLCVH